MVGVQVADRSRSDGLVDLDHVARGVLEEGLAGAAGQAAGLADLDALRGQLLDGLLDVFDHESKVVAFGPQSGISEADAITRPGDTDAGENSEVGGFENLPSLLPLVPLVRDRLHALRS